jgi:adenylate cyclase
VTPARGAGAFVEVQHRGVWRAAGAYLLALLLLVALSWLVRPEFALMTSVSHHALAVAGLVLAALAVWFFPATTAAVAANPGEPSMVSAPPLSDSAQASIAALPLENLTGTAEDDLLAQGFSAEIVRALSGVPDLRVTPFMQSAAYAGRGLQEVARQLNVRYVLSGSLQRSGGRLRVIAVLTDASKGEQAWSESYERDVDDLFRVQRELAEAIAIETGSRHLNIISNDLCRQPPRGLSAWSLTHKALTFWTVSYTREASAEAIGWLEQALELEPDNAVAHVLLGFVLNQRVVNAFTEDPISENQRALAEVQVALRLAPRDATVMEYAALVWLNCGMRRKSMQTVRRVLAIAPFNMIAWGYLGFLLSWGSTEVERDEGIAILLRLLKVAPNHPSVPFWHHFLAFAYAEREDYETSRGYAESSVDVHPGFCLGWVMLANALGMLGDIDGAHHAIAQAQHHSPLFQPQGYQHLLLAIAAEIGDSPRKQTEGLARAGLVPSLSAAVAA